MVHKILSIHFVGIGGISQSALAKIMKQQNKIVTGTDDNINLKINEFKKCGIQVFKATPREVLDKTDLVVYTNAVSKTHPDIVYAKQINKPILERANFLALLANNFSQSIAISGTHGKTTTTALTFFAMQSKAPTLHVGGIVNKLNSNFKIGKNKFFITEACEFNKSFLHLNPNVSVITNVECEHMNTFKTEENLYKSFIQFAKQTKHFIVVEKNSKISNLLSSEKLSAKLFEVSITTPCNLWAKNIKQENDKILFDCFSFNKKLESFCIFGYGKHNVLNCLFAIAVSMYYGIDLKSIKEGLKDYCGIKRRFETILACPLIIHDYAHHPTEINATLQTAKSVLNKPIICIFEPHTFTRTKTLLSKFKTCFLSADKLVILPTYNARESPIAGGKSEDLVKAVKEFQETHFIKSKENLFKFLTPYISQNYAFLFLGAGTIDLIANKFAKLATKTKTVK